MRGQLHILHPAARQQRHLQAEQVGRQAAGRLADVEVHPGEDRTRESSCCGMGDGGRQSRRTLVVWPSVAGDAL